MKKMINIRNLIIVILCITIILMGIGFAYLSLKLEKFSNYTNEFDISFVKVNTETPVKGGTTAPTGTTSITNQGKSINMILNMNVPQDELAYTITIKNTGTLPAEIINIVETPNYTTDATLKKQIDPVSISINDVVGKVLQPGEETRLKVVAIYNKTNNITSKEISYQLSILASTPKED